MSDLARAGLYLHVPFCSAVCPYCDFAVQTGNAGTRARFVDALCAEVALSQWTAPIDTIYFGGGTPSLLSQAQLQTVLETVTKHLPIAADVTVFFEANPEDVCERSLEEWRSVGVNFLSLGLQSFDDDELRRLGRRHNGQQARDALRRALSVGFETVSVDLMFGLPGQMVASWESTLSSLESLRPEHVSCYQLTIHEGTTFHRWRERGKLSELAEERQAELFAVTHARLPKLGLHAYEVSNFASSARHRSVHNQKYWKHAPYLGLGPSAHSFDGTNRWWNHTGIIDYTNAVNADARPIAEWEQLSSTELGLEALMLGLRTVDGIDLVSFKTRYNIDLMALNGRLIDDLIEARLLELTGKQVTPTVDGLAVADGLAARFRLDEKS